MIKYVQITADEQFIRRIIYITQLLGYCLNMLRYYCLWLIEVADKIYTKPVSNVNTNNLFAFFYQKHVSSN